MSTEPKDGGPAFPVDEKNHDGTHHHCNTGMTLRDWFAGMALQGLCAAHDAGKWASHTQSAAQFAYEHADAMISARSQS